MRNTLRKISIIVLALMLMLCTAVAAYADDGTVVYNGGGSFEFGPGSDMSATQLFPDMEGVMPGDVITQKISVTNNSSASDYIKMYLRAEAHGSDNPLETEVKNTETVETMTEFLKQLRLKVTNGSSVIFESSPDQTGGLTEDVLIGTLEKGQSLELVVELTVPADLGNEFSERSGEVDWIFTAEELNSGASVDLSMKETSRPEKKDGYQEGEVIEYEISVVNDGNVTLFDVVVKDPQTGDTFTIDKLEPGQSASFKTSHTVTAEDVSKGSFENSAEVSARPDNPDLDQVSAGPVKVVSDTFRPSEEPDTGDRSNIWLWGGILAAAVIIVIVLILTKKRDKDQ
ncbi:MAG: hypothetical protein II725_00765 [Firmicutes bacterium]|nr:hypothetical protein [Bacillota bacterium]